MLKLVDPNHVPATPKSWRTTHNGQDYRLPWNSSEPWMTFRARVKTFAATNGIPVPTDEQIEDFMCQQMPQGWCTGEATYRAPAPPRTGCSSCGRR